MKKLASNRSALWAFMEKFEVPDYDDPTKNYLTRWRIIQTPWFGIYLHKLGGPDPRRTLHDHPWKFTAFVLRGGYVERRLDPMTLSINEHHHITRINRMQAHGAHAIISLDRTPTWTLLFVGKRNRTWGYWDEPSYYPDEWRWTEFDKHLHAAEFERALKQRKAINTQESERSVFRRDTTEWI